MSQPEPTPIDRPRPALARATMTFCSPTDPTALVTVEVIVTDQDADGMADWGEMPEGQQAGWNAMQLGPYNVAMRAVGP